MELTGECFPTKYFQAISSNSVGETLHRELSASGTLPDIQSNLADKKGGEASHGELSGGREMPDM